MPAGFLVRHDLTTLQEKGHPCNMLVVKTKDFKSLWYKLFCCYFNKETWWWHYIPSTLERILTLLSLLQQENKRIRILFQESARSGVVQGKEDDWPWVCTRRHVRILPKVLASCTRRLDGSKKVFVQQWQTRAAAAMVVAAAGAPTAATAAKVKADVCSFKRVIAKKMLHEV